MDQIMWCSESERKSGRLIEDVEVHIITWTILG